MKKVNTKNNASAKKKLIPAAGSLLISAAMLGTSTYAWFTMSREVEVTNISMVATTPEDIQISLGLLGTNQVAETRGNGVSLATNTGYLVKGSGASNASNGQVAEPANDWDWSDTADFSHYYQIGKLMPASSITGENIFFTPDANGVGKTVKDAAVYYQANATTVNDASGASMSGMDATGMSGSGYAKATLHAVTDANDTWASTVGSGTNTNYTSGAGNYQKSTSWNVTNDDGYYVDIPVWLRTSSTETTAITVKGYVAPRTTTQKGNSNNEALYKAVRVAFLNPVQASGGNAISGTNLIDLMDGIENMSSGSAGQLKANPFASGSSILDWYTGGNNSGAVKQAGSGAVAGTGGVYGTPVKYTADSFVTLAPGTGGEYGAATKVIVRVWLEGNDPDCWNDTAGQDWYINLKFGRKGQMDDANIIGARINDGDNLTNTSGTGTYTTNH
jgi:hypothetical protein